MDALIVGRAICGLGGTGMYTGVLYAVYTKYERLPLTSHKDLTFDADG